jgi:hypothetical protein
MTEGVLGGKLFKTAAYIEICEVFKSEANDKITRQRKFYEYT